MCDINVQCHTTICTGTYSIQMARAYSEWLPYITVTHTRTRMQTGAMQLDAIHRGAVTCICIYDIYNMGVGFKIAHGGRIVWIYNIVSIAYVCVCFFNKSTKDFSNLKFLPEFLSFHLSFHFSFKVSPINFKCPALRRSTYGGGVKNTTYSSSY